MPVIDTAAQLAFRRTMA